MKHILSILLLCFFAFNVKAQLNDSTKTYSTPYLTKTLQGEPLLAWTEKDSQGMVAYCMALSNDAGKTFGEKQVIYTGAGINNSRLMRAKVLVKPNGELVAVFSNRPDVVASATPQQGRGGSRTGDIVYCVSTDKGQTWTSPKVVDADPRKCMRGFFDAVVLKNGEIAIAYLKDVENSTKHEERNLRLVLSKNGEFQPEKIIDPVVCDCCNISLLVDAKGQLNVYYRDNNDNIRDIAKMISTDNGQTFSKPEIVLNDGWKINGCPHNGATSVSTKDGNLIAWFSGAEKESGIRLANQKGKRLVIINNTSAKNAYLTAKDDTAVMLWEQNTSDDAPTKIAFRKIIKDKISDITWVEGSINATNTSAMVVDNQLIVAYEVKNTSKKNSIRWDIVNL